MFSRAQQIANVIILSVILCSCGQKGPLEIPEDEFATEETNPRTYVDPTQTIDEPNEAGK